MSPILACVASLICLSAGYIVYSRFLATRIFGIRDDEPMPSLQHEDGVDFVPTRREVLWGHHFASIAGAAPILGPAMAIVWGWVPALIWVVGGVIFMGAAHDFGALVISMRHDGQSVGSLAARYIGPRSRTLFLIIIFFLIWLVGAVFAFAIANLFTAFPASILPVNLEIVVALAMGWWGYRLKGSLLIPSLLALVGLYAVIWGTAGGHLWVPAEGSLLLSKPFWLVALMVYGFVAACLPVWLLLQPRDLINSHQLVVGLTALYVGFFISRPAFAAPAVGDLEALPVMFPLLFVTIACGAISGFHGLVSSGTTSKQLACATDARPIGYGAMLVEASLAVLATMAVAAGLWTGPEHSHAFGYLAERSAAGGSDGSLSLPQVGEALKAFVNGASGFLNALGLDLKIAATVVAVLVISFAATSLDTALRIQRLVIAELGASWGVRPLQNRWLGSGIAAGSILVLIYADHAQGAKSLWPVFGATNQILAAFTLLICALYLRTRKANALPYLVPAAAMATITFAAMTIQVVRDFNHGRWLVAGVGAIIAALAAWVGMEGVAAWRRPAEANPAPSAKPPAP